MNWKVYLALTLRDMNFFRKRKITRIGRKRFLQILSYPIIFALGASLVVAPSIMYIEDLKYLIPSRKLLTALLLSTSYLIGILMMVALYSIQGPKLNRYDKISAKSIIGMLLIATITATISSTLSVKEKDPQKKAVPLRV